MSFAWQILPPVSIHAPREGCDTFYPSYKSFGNKFQFTHPGRGATSAKSYTYLLKTFQFTHPGRGATASSYLVHRRPRVSIHAPREGCDLVCSIRRLSELSFNSRTPGGVRLTRSVS